VLLACVLVVVITIVVFVFIKRNGVTHRRKRAARG
jgi:hypothetical protein